MDDLKLLETRKVQLNAYRQELVDVEPSGPPQPGRDLSPERRQPRPTFGRPTTKDEAFALFRSLIQMIRSYQRLARGECSFRVGLARVATNAPELVPRAWGIKGCASVVGSVLTNLLAMHVGFTLIVSLALLTYAIAAMTFNGGSPRRSSSPIVPCGQRIHRRRA